LLIQAAAILGAATIRHIPDAFRGLGLIRTSNVLG
jgi:hypothetical protein